jgi:tetratricopeptide (TPR) repeat protein
MRMLKKAFDVDSENPLTLNQLAEHMFRKKQHKKALGLAYKALKLTDNDSVKAESHFHIARVHHDTDQLEVAYKHYYLSSKLYPEFVLTQYGLGPCPHPHPHPHPSDHRPACTSDRRPAPVSRPSFPSCHHHSALALVTHTIVMSVMSVMIRRVRQL